MIVDLCEFVIDVVVDVCVCDLDWLIDCDAFG